MTKNDRKRLPVKNCLFSFDIRHPMITTHDYRHMPEHTAVNTSTRDAQAFTDKQTP